MMAAVFPSPAVVSSIVAATIAVARSVVGSTLAQLLGVNLWGRPEHEGRRGRVSTPKEVTEGVHGDSYLLSWVRRRPSPLRRGAK